MQGTKTIRKKHSREGREDRIFRIAAITVVVFMTILVVIPLLNVIAASFSSSSAVNAGRVLLWPVEFTLDNYRTVLKYNSVWLGYRNTIFYTVTGTVLGVTLSLFCAYPLSQKRFSGRKFFSKLLLFTMIFHGGMVPTYIVVKKLGLLNSVWSVILPSAISYYNVVIMRNYMESTIPGELEDSARVDGCSPARYFIDFIVPLSKPIIAVIAMYYAVAIWNSYFNAFLYLNDSDLYPLQLFLREILVSNKFNTTELDPETASAIQGLADTLKYVVIVVSTLPLMCIYPFVQKHFVKGIMIGSVKG